MILSNVELHRALDQGRLVIDPEPLPREPSAGEHCPYDSHSVDLTLGPEISVPNDDQPYAFDLARRANLQQFLTLNSKREILVPGKPYQLERGKFILGMTRERVHLPILPEFDNCLAARIEGKSSRARLGLLIHFTAPTVHPGFEGTLTLEMINLGAAPILLQPGVAIAQLIVEKVVGRPLWNPSQFQGQRTPAGASRKRRVSKKQRAK